MALEVLLGLLLGDQLVLSQLVGLLELVPEALSRLIHGNASTHLLFGLVDLQVKYLLHELVLFAL